MCKGSQEQVFTGLISSVDQNVIIELFNSTAEANIVIDIITQTSSVDGLTDIGFTVSKSDFKRAFEIAGKFAEKTA